MLLSFKYHNCSMDLLIANIKWYYMYMYLPKLVDVESFLKSFWDSSSASSGSKIYHWVHVYNFHNFSFMMPYMKSLNLPLKYSQKCRNIIWNQVCFPSCMIISQTWIKFSANDFCFTILQPKFFFKNKCLEILYQVIKNRL